MTSVRQQLPATAQAIIGTGTAAGANVYLWRDWSLDPTKLPAVVLRARRADRADLTRGNGIPNFMATVYLEADCMASGTTNTAAESAAETLAEDQVLPAVMGLIIGPPQTFYRCSMVESEIEVKAEGKTHIATARMRFAFEYEEQYAPVLTTVLQRMVILAVVPGATSEQITALEAALNAGDSDVTLFTTQSVYAGGAIIAGADITIPS